MDRPRALLLDFGGTLAAERTSRGALYAQVARRFGLDVEPDEMSAAMREAHEALPRVVDGAFRYSRRWFERFIERIFRDRFGLSSPRLTAAQDELFELFSDARTFRVFPGARELVASARRSGAAVAVVSNWSDALPQLLADLDLTFDAVLCSAIEASEKPESSIFERALERIGGPKPQDTLHVGDSVPNDVQGAEALGIRAVLVDRRDRHSAFPGRRVRRLDELLGVFVDPSQSS